MATELDSISEVPGGVSLEEALQGSPHLDSLTNYGIKTVSDLAERALEDQKFIDSTIRVPGADAPPEKIREFRQKLGAPEDVSGYELPEVSDPQLGAIFEELRSVAHEEGMRKAPFERLVRRASEIRSQREKEFQDSFQAELREMNREISERLGPKASEKLAAGKRVIDKILDSLPDGSKVREIMKQTGLGEVPALVELLAEAGRATEGDRAPMSQDGAPAMEGTLEDAKKLALEAKTLSRQPAFKDRHHPEYEMTSLQYQQKLKLLYAMGFESVHDPRLASGIEVPRA